MYLYINGIVYSMLMLVAKRHIDWQIGGSTFRELQKSKLSVYFAEFHLKPYANNIFFVTLPELCTYVRM